MDYEGSRREFLEFLAQQDIPAFVRRAQRVDAAWCELKTKCNQQQNLLLNIPRIRLAVLAALVANQWTRLANDFIEANDVDYLEKLFARWRPRLQVQMRPTDSRRKIRRALMDLVESFDRFNSKWERFVHGLDLGPVNHVRKAYNDYYVIEKSCAFNSEKIGGMGFRKMGDINPKDVFRVFPLLRVPKLGGR